LRVPPPLAGPTRDRLVQAFGRISLLVDRLLRECGEEIVCRHGCAACCRQVLNLRGVEASFLLEGARALPGEAVSLIWQHLPASGTDGPCPLLHGGLCLAYDHRPAVCRTHGLPMLRREGGETLVHHCAENFRGADASLLSPSLLLDEERLSLLMDAVDALYCMETGWGGDRISVEQLLRSGLHT